MTRSYLHYGALYYCFISINGIVVEPLILHSRTFGSFYYVVILPLEKCAYSTSCHQNITILYIFSRIIYYMANHPLEKDFSIVVFAPTGANLSSFPRGRYRFIVMSPLLIQFRNFQSGVCTEVLKKGEGETTYSIFVIDEVDNSPIKSVKTFTFIHNWGIFTSGLFPTPLGCATGVKNNKNNKSDQMWTI